MFHRKKTITKLVMPSDRGLSDEAINELGNKYLKEKEEAAMNEETKHVSLSFISVDGGHKIN